MVDANDNRHKYAYTTADVLAEDGSRPRSRGLTATRCCLDDLRLRGTRPANRGRNGSQRPHRLQRRRLGAQPHLQNSSGADGTKGDLVLEQVTYDGAGTPSRSCRLVARTPRRRPTTPSIRCNGRLATLRARPLQPTPTTGLQPAHRCHHGFGVERAVVGCSNIDRDLRLRRRGASILDRSRRRTGRAREHLCVRKRDSCSTVSAEGPPERRRCGSLHHDLHQRRAQRTSAPSSRPAWPRREAARRSRSRPRRWPGSTPSTR